MKRRTLAILMATLAIVAGCSSPLSPEQKRTALREEGWAAYAEGNFPEAETKFRLALELDPRDGAAQIGVVWALIRQDRLASAVTAVGRVSAQDTSYRHALAARAIITDALAQPDQAFLSAQTILAQDSLYEFPRDLRINWRTLCYVAAKNALVLSSDTDPDLSRTMLYLARIDDGRRLVAGDPSTWVAGGRLHASLAAALARRLEDTYYQYLASNWVFAL